MTYSIDFRQISLSIRKQEGLSFSQVAKRFSISKNTLFLWSKRMAPKRTRNKPAIKIDMQN